MDLLISRYVETPLRVSVLTTFITLIILLITQNIIRQLFFPSPNKPPVVFHLIPFIGSTIPYGIDPYKFFAVNREKYGDCFTFILLGKPTTVYLGPKGNDFILNGKHKDLNAEEVYGKLTTPIFGKGVIYDCSNERFMDQKRLLKEGFTTTALKAYIPQFVKEVTDYVTSSTTFKGDQGLVNVTEAMGEITIYTASSSLQGHEIRSSFDSTFASLYRHLDDSFIPINFILPGLPLPRNRRRDHAQRVMEELYGGVIERRRTEGNMNGDVDMIWNLMEARYKDGSHVPDSDIARLMIALLMGGQHNTAASGAWILLHLANQPHVMNELYQEQLDVLGLDEQGEVKQLDWEGLQKLTLNNSVIKETLRLHSPIHSILRQVKSPMPVPGTRWIIPPTHTVLACPTFSARLEENFLSPLKWDPHRWQQPQQASSSSTTNNKDDEEDEKLKIDYGFGKVSKAVGSPYLPFGAGRHRCVGEQYAYAQLGAIIATLVRLMRLEQIDPQTPVPATDFSSMFSRPMNPATVKWRKC